MAMKEWHRASLAERIHLHRIWLNMSAEELARQSGISTSYLSKIERGRSVPSVDVLERLAAGLGTTASQLLSDAPPFTETPERHSHTPEAVMVHRLRPTVVRKGERKKIRPPNSTLDYELLTPDLQRKLEFTMVHYPPHHRSIIFTHVGEESMLCLRGSVRVFIGDEEYALSEGDSLSFDPAVPHYVVNDTDLEAVLISAETPASF